VEERESRRGREGTKGEGITEERKVAREERKVDRVEEKERSPCPVARI
jgi:hypothetical protein